MNKLLSVIAIASACSCSYLPRAHKTAAVAEHQQVFDELVNHEYQAVTSDGDKQLLDNVMEERGLNPAALTVFGKRYAWQPKVARNHEYLMFDVQAGKEIGPDGAPIESGAYPPVSGQFFVAIVRLADKKLLYFAYGS